MKNYSSYDRNLLYRKEQIMSNLIVSIFKNKSEAELARRHLLAKDRHTTLGLQDVVTAEKAQTGKIRFHHLTRFTLGGAVGGAFLGVTAGILFLNPVFAVAGLFVGFIVGLVYGSSSSIGINPEAARSQAQNLNPGQAALFVASEGNPAQLAEQIDELEGDHRQTSICAIEGGSAQCRPWRPSDFGPAVP
jgi:uncharacterized membrane protein